MLLFRASDGSSSSERDAPSAMKGEDTDPEPDANSSRLSCSFNAPAMSGLLISNLATYRRNSLPDQEVAFARRKLEELAGLSRALDIEKAMVDRMARYVSAQPPELRRQALTSMLSSRVCAKDVLLSSTSNVEKNVVYVPTRLQGLDDDASFHARIGPGERSFTTGKGTLGRKEGKALECVARDGHQSADTTFNSLTVNGLNVSTSSAPDGPEEVNILYNTAGAGTGADAGAPAAGSADTRGPGPDANSRALAERVIDSYRPTEEVFTTIPVFDTENEQESQIINTYVDYTNTEPTSLFIRDSHNGSTILRGETPKDACLQSSFLKGSRSYGLEGSLTSVMASALQRIRTNSVFFPPIGSGSGAAREPERGAEARTSTAQAAQAAQAAQQRFNTLDDNAFMDVSSALSSFRSVPYLQGETSTLGSELKMMLGPTTAFQVEERPSAIGRAHRARRSDTASVISDRGGLAGERMCSGLIDVNSNEFNNASNEMSLDPGAFEGNVLDNFLSVGASSGLLRYTTDATQPKGAGSIGEKDANSPSFVDSLGGGGAARTRDMEKEARRHADGEGLSKHASGLIKSSTLAIVMGARSEGGTDTPSGVEQQLSGGANSSATDSRRHTPPNYFTRNNMATVERVHDPAPGHATGTADAMPQRAEVALPCAPEDDDPRDSTDSGHAADRDATSSLTAGALSDA